MLWFQSHSHWLVCGWLFILTIQDLEIEMFKHPRSITCQMKESARHFLDGQVNKARNVPSLVLGSKIRFQLRLCVLNGKSSASYKEMNLGKGMTSWNPSHKLGQVWMSGITRFRSNWLYVDTNKKPQISYQRTYSYLVCRTKSFSQSACQR